MPDATPTQEALSAELDEALLAAVRKVKAAAEDEGPTEINAAILNAATARLRALGLTMMVKPGSKTEELAREFGLHDPNTIKMPSISDEPDARQEIG